MSRGRCLWLCAAYGDRHREAALHNYLADLLHTANRSDEVMTHLKQAVTIFAQRRIQTWSLARPGIGYGNIWLLN